MVFSKPQIIISEEQENQPQIPWHFRHLCLFLNDPIFTLDLMVFSYSCVIRVSKSSFSLDNLFASNSSYLITSGVYDKSIEKFGTSFNTLLMFSVSSRAVSYIINNLTNIYSIFLSSITNQLWVFPYESFMNLFLNPYRSLSIKMIYNLPLISDFNWTNKALFF